jgi:hypothetical protein
MAISQDTTEAILNVVMRHVTRDQLQAILQDLAEVPGNASFRASVEKLLAASAQDRR